MSLYKTLSQYIEASYSGLWLVTHESEEAHQVLGKLCLDKQWQLACWDHAKLLRASKLFQETASPIVGQAEKLAALLRAIPKIHKELGNSIDRTIVVLENCHRNDVMRDLAFYPQILQDLILEGRKYGWCIIMMSPVLNLPPELDRLFTVVEHDLPSKSDLWRVANEFGEIKPASDVASKKLLLEAAAGLTIMEAENAFSLSVIRDRPFDPEIVWEQKANTLAKNGLLELYTGDADMQMLGGVDHAKEFCTQLLSPRDEPELYSKGVLLLGVSGGGKSEFTKALGRHTGRRVLIMNVGQLRSKWQGETDQNLKRALATADAMAPCILMIDEVEKALAGVGGSESDGGTGARTLGTLLSWMNDHTSDVFMVCTCNDLQSLLSSNPEFARQERFDGIFFFDLPDEAARRTIWAIYGRKYYKENDPTQNEKTMQALLAMSEGWTGAEIRAATRLSRILNKPLLDMQQLVIPISQTSNAIERTRQWASGVCLAADVPGRYRAERTKGLDQESRERRKLFGADSGRSKQPDAGKNLKVKLNKKKT